MTPTEIIADVCAAPWVEPADRAECIIARLEREGWEIRRKAHAVKVIVTYPPNLWPPPQPGTHESDLFLAGLIEWQSDEIFPSNYTKARNWSRQNNPERTTA